MGLLDEAIREHLELKRRRGADPGEVAREQREALTEAPEGPTGSEGELAPEEALPEAVEGGDGANAAEGPPVAQDVADVELIDPLEAPDLSGAVDPPATPGTAAAVDPSEGLDRPERGGAEYEEGSTLGEETAEIDMQTVLDEGDDPHQLSSPPPPAFTEPSGERFNREAGEEQRQPDDELSDVYRPLPGQERMPFE